MAPRALFTSTRSSSSLPPVTSTTSLVKNGWGFCSLWQQHDVEGETTKAMYGWPWRCLCVHVCHVEVHRCIKFDDGFPLGLVCTDYESSESITSSCWFEPRPLSKIYTRPKQQNGDIVTSFMSSWLLDCQQQKPLNMKSQNSRDFMASKPMLLPNNQNLSNWTHNSAHIYCAIFMFWSAPPPNPIKHLVLQPVYIHSKEKNSRSFCYQIIALHMQVLIIWIIDMYHIIQTHYITGTGTAATSWSHGPSSHWGCIKG